MNRNGILMAIAILAALTLLTSLSMADRGDHGGGGGGRGDQSNGSSNHSSSTTATQSTSSHSSSQSQSAKSSTYTPSTSSGYRRNSSSGYSGRSTTYTPYTGTWQSHASPSQSYPPTAGGNGGTWRSRNSDAAGTAAATSNGGSWRSHTTGGQYGQGRATTSTSSRPSFNTGSANSGGKATTEQGSGQGSASGSWRDHVRGGTQSGGQTSQTGHGTQGGAVGTAADHRGRPEFKVQGQRLDFPRSPEQRDGHWAAPARAFFDRVGARLWEDSNDGYYHARRGDHEFRFRIGDRNGWYDDREFLFPCAPYLLGGFLYCSLDPFADYWGVPYDVEYVPEPYPVYVPAPQAPQAAEVGKGLAIATATEYLRNVGAYPTDVQDVTAHENSAPANRFWDLVTAGHDPIPDAPMRMCWIVEFDYPGGWQQVFIDAGSGEVIGGSAS
jgi:hypothetical protein